MKYTSNTPEEQNDAVSAAHTTIDALKSTEKMRIEFVANVSHELRTPLTSIKGYAETLLQDFEEGREMDPQFLRVIIRNSNRLLELIQDLLDLSAIESGVDALHLSKVSTQEVTDHALSQLKRASKEKNITIEVKNLCAWVMADAKRLEQIVTNLADNAIKYCPPGSKVSIEWRKEESNEGQAIHEGAVILDVTDNGPGIPEEHLARLFERFYRIDQGRSRETGGTGLGLSIVKHIIQRHDATVSVESEMGKGTRFSCRFKP